MYNDQLVYKVVIWAFFGISLWTEKVALTVIQFSVPQIEYPLRGSSKNDSHVYFLLIVAMVLLL